MPPAQTLAVTLLPGLRTLWDVLLAASTVRYEGFHGLSFLLLAAAFLVLALWLLAFGYRWWHTRPDLPAAGPEISELPPNPVPPAVVNFLVNNWRVTTGAISATLLDLAARRFLGVELAGHDGTVVRLRDTPPAGALAPFEEQVYQLVTSHTAGGSAPIEAINLGEPDAAHRWIAGFEKAVVNDARARGLARRRWERIDYLIVGAGLALIFGLFALAFGAAHVGEHPGTNGSMSPSDWLLAAGMAWLGGIALVTRSQAMTDTPAGRAECARWLGMRRYFHESHAFDNQPPASVTIWDRLLGYGVATGAAGDAAHGLPIAAEDPHSAWSRSTGNWREIRIDYPERFSFGQRPLFVFAEGLGRTVFWGAIAFAAYPAVAVGGWQILRDLINHAGSYSLEFNAFIAVFAGAFVLLGVYLVARTIGGLIRLGRGALDLRHTVTVEGQVVKVHNGRFAIDDGQSASVDALIAPPAGPPVRVGQGVKAVVSPHLRHLSRLDIVHDVPADPADAELEPGPGALREALFRQLAGR